MALLRCIEDHNDSFPLQDSRSWDSTDKHGNDGARFSADNNSS